MTSSADRRGYLGLTTVDEVVTLCAEIFPGEPIPDRALLVLEDALAEGES